MNNKTFIKVIKELGACDDAVYWCQSHGGTMEELWQDCERGDWMWWLLVNTDMPKKEQSLALARWCANRVDVNAPDYSVYADAYADADADAAAAIAGYAADAAADTADTAAAVAAAGRELMDSAARAVIAADWAAVAAADAYVAAADAYVAAADAYAAAAYVAERKVQAEYIRANFNCPTLDKSKESE